MSYSFDSFVAFLIQIIESFPFNLLKSDFFFQIKLNVTSFFHIHFQYMSKAYSDSLISSISESQEDPPKK